MRTSLKALTATATAALLVSGLAACSSGEPTASSTPTAAAATCQNVKSGATSDSVKVAGDFGKTPTVTFGSPLKATDLERTVVVKGTGAVVKAGSNVDIALAAYNGTTGKELSAQGFDGSATAMLKVDDKAFVPGLVRAVECLPLGSRVVLTGPAGSAVGQQNLAQLNLTDKDSIVFVADLVDLPQTRANGKAVTPPAGFPKVTLDAKTGEPDITIPKADPPKETKIAVLKQGDGETVQSGDTVTVQYKGVLWRNGQMFDSSWSRGTPAAFQTTQVVKGFQQALEGQKVGSQVIAIVPPADGYGDKGSGDIKATDTMVFVIDILKTTR
ncbi:FKBP-type peptidyl-prolyl cis-trans isomerase [Leifsonia virtsii]|uniref:peptidylprolyl isomerase n=1 Tax=Leifsonia virtsii TaxID=3035915 RepID=A0ABT8IU27_9MICO|nr:FKBP-type peptidyl-prolyl cis-trans isomerase [Leifsonia virtsii]MDN4596285.1 FKBP-type peptidyl-prolyl cis-trans isomerase [Leifsonia virtsii]